MNPSSILHPPSSCLLYGRVSTGQQTTSTQETRGKEYIAWKQLTLAAEFYDDDTSGTIPIWDRPGGRRLRDFLERGCVADQPQQRHLVVLKLDRLGRSAIDLLKTVEFLDSLNVVLHIVDMGGDSLSTQGPSGRLMFTVLAGMAEYERELITGRIRDRLSVKRAKGELCGTVPYGWDAVETGAMTPKGVKVRKLADNSQEQHWILIMHQLRSRSNMSYGKIAEFLNSQSVPTKRDKGTVMNGKFVTGKWQAGNVHHVLTNQTVQAWLAAHPDLKAA